MGRMGISDGLELLEYKVQGVVRDKMGVIGRNEIAEESLDHEPPKA